MRRSNDWGSNGMHKPTTYLVSLWMAGRYLSLFRRRHRCKPKPVALSWA